MKRSLGLLADVVMKQCSQLLQDSDSDSGLCRARVPKEESVKL